MALCVSLAWSVLMRQPLLVDVLRDRNALYREVHGDRIENSYQLKIINEDTIAHRYRIRAQGLDGLTLAEPATDVTVAGGSVLNVATRLQLPSAMAAGVHTVTVSVVATDNPRLAVTEKTRFLGPHS
jgi:polyferredoxin